LKYFRHSDLGNFLSVTKDSKLRLSHENFLAANEAGLPAFNSQTIVKEYLFNPGL
jgi:hypothetical protein